MMHNDERGKCPHCMVVNKFENIEISRVHDNNFEKFEYVLEKVSSLGLSLKSGFSEEYIDLELFRCANCGKNIISVNGRIVYPIGSSRPLCPSEVPIGISQDYTEACLVEPYSKKASAALSRRCLQNMLRDKGIKKSDLSKEIDEAMKTLPSHLAESIDAIRLIGNFAAHPLKSASTGEIVDVEDEEAEWALDVLEDLFDFYYVQPAAIQRKREAMNRKLVDLGKPPIKTPTKSTK